jgi:hypothetical protein
LYRSVNAKLFRWTALTPKQNGIKEISKDGKWKILINEEIEGDV